MAHITRIKPVKGSGKFVDPGSARIFKVQKDKNGREVKSGGTQFKGEKFPMSRQMLRPKYSISKQRWLIDMPDDELIELIKECRFKYAKSHPKRGQYIDECFIHDAADPFFNHLKLKVISVEGEVALRDDNAVHNILLASFKADPDFQTGDGGRSMLSSRTKFVISDKRIETQAKMDELKVQDEALDLFKALTYSDKKKIARALYLPIDDNVEPVDLDLLLRSKIDSREKVRNGGLYRTAFIEACKLSKEDLTMRDLLQRAKRLSIIRKKVGGYEFMGQYIGKRIDTVENYFLDPEHQEMFSRLEVQLKEAELNRPH